jgi:hypothetical protein
LVEFVDERDEVLNLGFVVGLPNLGVRIPKCA